MNRFVGEGVAFVVGLMACCALFLPEHHNHEWWNYTLFEKVGRHPVAALLLLGTWGTIAVLTIRKLVVQPPGRNPTP